MWETRDAFGGKCHTYIVIYNELEHFNNFNLALG